MALIAGSAPPGFGPQARAPLIPDQYGDDPMQNLMGVDYAKEEAVIYYRLPKTTRGRAGWITWADSQPTKQRMYSLRGWEPLWAYGRIWTDNLSRPECRNTARYGPWWPILSHPDGPSEFPIDQILTFRWYKPERIGINPPNFVNPIPNVTFPQLVEGVRSGDVEVTEYACPDGCDREFHVVGHLARHLRNHHEYEMTDILAYGEALGVNFQKEFTSAGKKVYTLAELTGADAPAEESEPLVPVTKVDLPPITRGKK